MDGARIKALCDKDIVGFDMNGLLVTNCDTWNANQDTYAVAKIDKARVLSHKIQLLGPKFFVASSLSRVSSTASR